MPAAYHVCVYSSMILILAYCYTVYCAVHRYCICIARRYPYNSPTPECAWRTKGHKKDSQGAAKPSARKIIRKTNSKYKLRDGLSSIPLDLSSRRGNIVLILLTPIDGITTAN